MAKVTFDGVQRLIIAEPGVTTLEIKADVYTAWKEWAVQANNAMYAPAISVIGGDPIGGGVSLGSTYFLENGWKIRPQEADHSLTIKGNIYDRDGGSPLVSTLGNFNVIVSMSRSNLIDTIATGGGAGGTVDLDQLAAAVWNKAVGTPSAGTMGSLVKTIDGKVDDTMAIAAGSL
jgi:hypothetical protein